MFKSLISDNISLYRDRDEHSFFFCFCLSYKPKEIHLSARESDGYQLPLPWTIVNEPR